MFSCQDLVPVLVTSVSNSNRAQPICYAQLLKIIRMFSSNDAQQPPGKIEPVGV